jgi:co-chaperonin GroES (HSP10)
MTLSLLENKIAVIPLDEPDKIGHIWVPDQAKQRTDQGVVRYKGPDVKGLFLGDHVLFGGYTGTKISVEGEGVFFIMREDDVVARIDDEDSEPLLSFTAIKNFLDEVEGEFLSRHDTSDFKPDDPFTKLILSQLQGAIKFKLLAEGLLDSYMAEKGFEF